jgi:cytochrome c-type biogenesis protein CcmH/NrfF
MALIWMAPAVTLVVACVLTWRWQLSIERRTEQLQGELRALPILADDTRSVRTRSDQIARATTATGAYFGSVRRH